MSNKAQNGPSSPGYVIRKARPEDCGEIAKMIKELAEHDGLGHKVFITENRTSLAGYLMYFFMYDSYNGRFLYVEDVYIDPSLRGNGEVNPVGNQWTTTIVYHSDGQQVSHSRPPQAAPESTQIIGYAMYFFMYCTFVGRLLFLEDFYVYPQFRGSGIGTELMVKLAQVGVEKKCTKIEFIVHEGNSRVRGFYEKLGAVNSTVEGDWRRFYWYKFDVPAMEKLANRQS